MALMVLLFAQDYKNGHYMEKRASRPNKTRDSWLFLLVPTSMKDTILLIFIIVPAPDPNKKLGIIWVTLYKTQTITNSSPRPGNFQSYNLNNL